MKKIHISIIAIIVLILSQSANAQELKTYNLYNQNPYLYNPAFSVDDQLLNAYLNTHLQWVGLTGAPEVYSFGASSSFFKNMGAGITMFNSQQGLVSNFDAKIHYAYQINFSKTHHLRMGTSLGIINDKLLVDQAANVDLTDEKLNENYFNKTAFSTGLGFAYTYNNLDAQVILPQLYEYNSSKIYTIGIVGYNFDINESLDLKPSVMVRGAKTSPMQFDGNLMATWNEIVWGQMGYRSNNSYIFSVGTKIGDYGIGYAYQANTMPISVGSAGSHEIQIVVNIKKKEKEIKALKATLSGKVESKIERTPIDAQIKIYLNDKELKTANSTNPIGEYLSSVETGKTYKIEVSADGYKTATQLIVVDKRASEVVTNFFLVAEKTKVSGVVTDKNNNETVEADIKISQAGNEIATTKSDENGKYEIELLSGSDYEVEINAESYENETTKFTIIQDAEKQTQNFSISPKRFLSGVVSDQKTGKPLSVTLEIYDAKTNAVIATKMTDASGKYSIELSDISQISISAIAPKYLFYSENITIDEKATNTEKNIQLKAVEIGASVVLNNVNFDFGKSELRPEAIPEIDRLVYLMIQYPEFNVEISGHTDNKGTVKYNKELSQKRAEAVVAYMVSKGVNKNRLKAVGYGPLKPRSNNDTDEGRQLNRRVEAEVVK